MIQISSWYLRQPKGASPFHAPELTGLSCAGTVSGHPTKADGERVTTSRIVRVEGRHFWTESGSEYELVGDPEPRYLEFLKSIGRSYCEAEPIKVVGVRHV